MSVKISNLFSQSRRYVQLFQEETGQSLVVWALIALLSLLTQIILHGVLLPGEFGTFNTTLGVIGLMSVPLVALVQTYTWYLARKHGPEQKEHLEALRSSSPLVIETLTWGWAMIALVLVFITVPLLLLPRFSLQVFTVLNVLVALGTLLSGVVYRNAGRLQLWICLLLGAAFVRLVLCLCLGSYEPWSESALGAFFIAGLITFAPVLNPIEAGVAERLKALKTILYRPFLIDLGAVFSVFLGIFLFSSADRIVAQSWFGSAVDNNIGYVDWPMFDAYQTAGLLARSILWGTQPLLLILYVRRSRVEHTTAASLDWFWIYLGFLITGVTLLLFLKQPVSAFFCGKIDMNVVRLIPSLGIAMIPLGLLQGMGMFGLASRRYPECFVFGACSIGYTLLLYLVGRHPVYMPAYMFGGGLVAAMIVLFVGVVRWGRKQP